MRSEESTESGQTTTVSLPEARGSALYGTFEVLPSAACMLEIRRRREDAVAALEVNLEDHSFVVRSQRDGETREARTFGELCTLLE